MEMLEKTMLIVLICMSGPLMPTILHNINWKMSWIWKFCIVHSSSIALYWQVICGATSKFSLLLYVHDLLTFDDPISILICMVIFSMHRVHKYKHFKGYFVVLWFILPNIHWFMFPHTPKFWFPYSVGGRDLWRHFRSYHRVTKSLLILFWCATWWSLIIWKVT